MLIAKGFYTPSKMAEKMAEIENHTADARVVSLPFQTVTDDQITITEEDYKPFRIV